VGHLRNEIGIGQKLKGRRCRMETGNQGFGYRRGTIAFGVEAIEGETFKARSSKWLQCNGGLGRQTLAAA
jgi:hypothetical protein